jgi:ribosomal protein L30E
MTSDAKTRSAQALGLCMKARKLISGFDAVIREASKGPKAVSGIVMASDISSKTEKEILFYSDKYGVPAIKIIATMDSIAIVLKKRIGVFAVTDNGLFQLLCTHKKTQED